MLYDILEEFEIKNLLDLYNVAIAKPLRIRSKSICYSNLKQPNELKPFHKKSISIERFDDVNCSYKQSKITANNTVLDSIERKKLLSDENTDSIYPSFNSRDLQQPSFFSIGSSQLKKSVNKTDSNDILKINANKLAINSYSHIESKLASYLTSSKEKPTNVNRKRAKTAIGLFKESSIEFDYYERNPKPRQANNSRLKLSSPLNKTMREDIRQNRGPIYFGELNEENLNTLNTNGYLRNNQTTLSDKFLIIFEWMIGMEEKECEHFFSNPFIKEDFTNTLISNHNPETDRVNRFISESVVYDDCNHVAYNLLTSMKHKIDPFINPRYENSSEIKLPKYKLISSMGKESFIQIDDKKVLSVKKDFKTLLNLNKNYSKESNQTPSIKKDIYGNHLKQADFLPSREKLRKKVSNNDLLKTRMRLDLFLL